MQRFLILEIGGISREKKDYMTFYSVLKMPISDIISCSIEAERAGFEYISVAESFYRDASVLSSAIATNTTKIKLGSSVYPIPTRTPFQIAMANATLNEGSNGRVGFIGLGVGYKARIEQYFGLRIEKSLSKMREYTEIIKGLLSGNDFSYKGRYFNFQGFPKLLNNSERKADRDTKSFEIASSVISL